MSGWTDERVDKLRKLWAQGLSASQIATELRGVTRNAVIGKATRLGLEGRAAASRPSRPAQRVAQPAPPAAPRPLRAPPVASAPKQDAGLAFRTRTWADGGSPEAPESTAVLTLGAHMCKWPIGDPRSPAFAMCGRQADGPYCVEHARVAYQPRNPKRAHTGNELMRSLRKVL